MSKIRWIVVNKNRKILSRHFYKKHAEEYQRRCGKPYVYVRRYKSK